jgi:GNAT superfamily N-acetyltransferase
MIGRDSDTAQHTRMQRFSIAAAKLDDCRVCAGLLVEQLQEHSIDSSVKRLSSILESIVADQTRGFVLVARVEGQIVGLAYAAAILSVEHGGPVVWLEELYVAPDHRSHGIGSALIGAVIEHARVTGIVAVDLEVDASHRRVESLYRQHGFQRLDRSRWVRKVAN